MRLATWNINSIRIRAEPLERLVTWLQPDVICLQETKVPDPLFPKEVLTGLGYPHIAIAGMKSYNGVAIASRLPMTNVTTRSFCGREDCRHLSAVIEGIEVHCLYIPAGGDIPDAELNPKFAHKLGFLDEITAWLAAERHDARPRILMGDLNIAPLPTDVWSHKQLLDVVSHTPIEVEKLAALQATQRWADAVRHFVPPEIRLYSWWSYRAADWSASDRGRRLDHIWVNPALTGHLTGATVLREARGWDRTSDHVPVSVDIA